MEGGLGVCFCITVEKGKKKPAAEEEAHVLFRLLSEGGWGVGFLSFVSCNGEKLHTVITFLR